MGRGAAQAVLGALPDPLILLDERRRILRANAAANELFGMRLVERDLALAVRHPAVLTAADAVLRGEPSRIVEFDITAPVERHLSARLAAIRPHTAEGAAAGLPQVSQNLRDNASKYSRRGTTIDVGAHPSPRFLPGVRPGERPAALAITVRDHGEGIARDHLPRLTERFYRVDAARSRELGGTGLGLAIVKHIVSHHRGALDIDSELGEGTVFTVHLPLAAES